MQEMYNQLLMREVMVEFRKDNTTMISFATTISGIYEWMDGFMLVGDNGNAEIYVEDYLSIYDDDAEDNYFSCNSGTIIITPM